MNKPAIGYSSVGTRVAGFDEDLRRRMGVSLRRAAPVASRCLKVLFGTLYTAIEIWTFSGSRPFFQVVVGFEVLLSVLIVFHALRWPRRAG